MEPIYQQDFEIRDICVDRYGRLKPSAILYFAQEIAGRHCDELALDYDTLARKRLFWAVTRHRVQVTRLPMRGETIHVETWPMPTTRVAFPRSMVAYDKAGNECFRSISLWVLMDLDTRNMILPGKSGIVISGTLRGTELALPNGLVPKPMSNSRSREVRFTDLDRNGHMNNTRYLDWIDDLLPSPFHEEHPVKEFTVCYHSEAREGQNLSLSWDFLEDGCLRVDAHRRGEQKDELVFSAKLLFD
ncbi:MAG: thioesterase [Firmicutes bacterium]|nr:thioesterase [Bacillota bacterium]